MKKYLSKFGYNIFMLWIGLFLALPLILLGALFFVFWIIMLVDSITRKYKRDSEKIVWVLVIILTGIIGALIYYSVVFIKDKGKSLKWFWWTILALFIITLIAFVLWIVSSIQVIY